MENLGAFKKLLSSPQQAVVVTHFKPDADALGSSLGLAGYLLKKGHTVHVITPSDYPEFLAWMPGHPSVLMVKPDQPQTSATARKLIADATVIFCLDFSSLKRIDSLEEPVRLASATKVMIDHHLEPENFAAFTQWDVSSASTAGLVYRLINELGDTHLIDADMANCLYAGLMTDTGGFRHNNTTHTEFMIASALVGLGADPSKVAKLVYDTNTLERLRLTGYVLSKKLQVLPEYATAYMALTAEELKQFGSQTGDTEGLVNYGLSVKGVKLSVLMYERKSEIKISLRSLGSFSVNEMARRHFSGGGHRNAAGGTSHDNLETTLKRFLDLLPGYQNELRTTP